MASALGIKGRTWGERSPEENALILAELDIAQEVLDGFAAEMRALFPTTTLTPPEWGRHVWDNCPTLGDALRVLRKSPHLDRLLEAHPELAEEIRQELRDGSRVL